MHKSEQNVTERRHIVVVIQLFCQYIYFMIYRAKEMRIGVIFITNEIGVHNLY